MCYAHRGLSAPVVDIKEENDDIYLAPNRHCLGNDMVPEKKKNLLRFLLKFDLKTVGKGSAWVELITPLQSSSVALQKTEHNANAK